MMPAVPVQVARGRGPNHALRWWSLPVLLSLLLTARQLMELASLHSSSSSSPRDHDDGDGYPPPGGDWSAPPPGFRFREGFRSREINNSSRVGENASPPPISVAGGNGGTETKTTTTGGPSPRADDDDDGSHHHLYMEISISTTDAVILGEVEPEYVSSTLDWWPLDTEAWGNASVLNADLRNPALMAAAGGLSPSFLRVGGSQADEILYRMGDEDDAGDEGAMIADECRRHPQRCLTRERWDEVLDFARDAGARIVFTIAYLRHTRDIIGGGEDYDVRDWDPSNARTLLERTRSNGGHASLGTVYGFELGNEVRHRGKATNVTRMVEAYRELGRMVDEVWDRGEGGWDGDGEGARAAGGGGRRRPPKPMILGPASTGVGETSHLISHIGPYVDVATYHKYHGGGKDPDMHAYARKTSFHVHPVKLSGPGEAVAKHVVGRRRRVGGGGIASDGDDYDDGDGGERRMASRLWIGEGAMAYNSGLRGVSDAFRGSLWFANLLGALTKTRPLSHGVYCRQSLLGGHYELVGHENMVPNPDYWVAYLWKELVGTRAVGPILSPGRKDSAELSSLVTFGCCEKPGRDTVLVHSFCARRSDDDGDDGNDNNDGDVVFVVINISESRGINLNITMGGGDRSEYALRPNNGEGMDSRGVSLNGVAMSIGSDASLPDVRGRGVSRVRGDLIHVPPIAVTFVVVHGADVEVCLPSAL